MATKSPLDEAALRKCLDTAVLAAQEAGNLMLECFMKNDTANSIEEKANSADLVTKYDRQVEELVLARLKSAYPGFSVIAEETEHGTLTDAPTWIVDPIDGTTNFVAGLHPLTCVSIGYCVDGTPVVGVIYVPSTQELYLGVQGYGAYRNGHKLSQQASTATKSLREAVICNEMGYTRNAHELDILLGAQRRLYVQGCQGFRQLGSGCLDLCYVASGRLDLVYAGLCTEGWKPWDYAAGYIIIKEAGCYMEPIYTNATTTTITNTTATEDKNDDGAVSSSSAAFDLYGTSVICSVSKELLDEVRAVILDDLPIVD